MLSPATKSPSSVPAKNVDNAPSQTARAPTRAETAAGPEVEGLKTLQELGSRALKGAQDVFQHLPPSVIETLGKPFVGPTGHARTKEHQRRCAIAYALVGLSVVNTFAPIWGPAIAGQAKQPLTDGLHQVLERIDNATDAETGAGSPAAVRMALLKDQALKRAPEIKGEVRSLKAKAIATDAQLQALDDALALPSGASKAVVVEGLLSNLGFDPASAKTLAHLADHSERASDGFRQLVHDVKAGELDLVQKSEDVAGVLDKIVTDKTLTLAFLAGYAMVPAPLQDGAAGAISVAQVLGKAKARHDNAVSHLKNFDSKNAAVDAIVHRVGDAVDATTFALLFVGPLPLTKVARGSDLMLIASEMVAAKTAVKSTEKSLSAFSNLPENVASFALGVTAAHHVRAEAKAMGLEAQDVQTQVGDLVAGLQSAAEHRDPQEALTAVHQAWDSMTPHERQVLQHVLQAGAEKMATGA